MTKKIYIHIHACVGHCIGQTRQSNECWTLDPPPSKQEKIYPNRKVVRRWDTLLFLGCGIRFTGGGCHTSSRVALPSTAPLFGWLNSPHHAESAPRASVHSTAWARLADPGGGIHPSFWVVEFASLVDPFVGGIHSLCGGSHHQVVPFGGQLRPHSWVVVRRVMDGFIR